MHFAFKKIFNAPEIHKIFFASDSFRLGPTMGQEQLNCSVGEQLKILPSGSDPSGSNCSSAVVNIYQLA